MIRIIARFIAFIVSKYGDSAISNYSRARCPWCDSYRKHSPLCLCATRQELRDAYQWTQGQLKGIRESTDRDVKTWVTYYETQKQANTILRRENNKLRAAKFPTTSRKTPQRRNADN